MEDLAGVIIYLIIAIIGVLAGVYRNKAKRAQASAGTQGKAPQEPAADYDPFSGLFEEDEQEYKFEDKETEELTEEPEEEFIEKERIETEKASVAEEEKPKEAEDYKKEYTEGEAAFKETEEAIIPDSITDKSESIILKEKEMPLSIEDDLYALNKEDFDLRKAIIYSEIINRKDF